MADRGIQQRESLTELLAAISRGLASLTITGPSLVLNSLYREALEAVTRRPTQEERELAISRAWAASSKAIQGVREGSQPAASGEAERLYGLMREAISASRPA